MKSKKYIILLLAGMLFGASNGRGDIGPVALTIIGMSTVFLGLVIMNLFINLLKSAVNPPEKPAKTESKPSGEAVQERTEAERTNLTDDELFAVALAVHIENELNYSVYDETLTLNWGDKEPSWFRIRK